ncbi:MAG: helix-hairpin-helix domain-containing protein, partial [Planctomycetota bacterium]
GMTPEEALQGISDILAEKVSEHAEVRGELRELARKEGILVSKARKSKEGEVSRFQNYYDYTEKLSEIPAHRMLALRRGEKEKILNVEFVLDPDKTFAILCTHFPLGGEGPKAEYMKGVYKDAAERLLSVSIGNEVRAELKREADWESIEVFSQNLKEILLSPPAGECVVIGVDPGVRTGSKLAVVDTTGKFLDSGLIYVIKPEPKPAEAEALLRTFIDKYKPKFIAVGNGTASRETEKALRDLLTQFENPPDLVIVNESGASIYSASELGREEFPNLDITVRGAISIARRLQDPLAELIKVDPRSIGVGQYQYDVNQTLLRQKLDEVVESAVNLVGVDVNTASAPLLSYVSGIGPAVSRTMVEYRNQNGRFASRARLMDVKGLGPKSFEQCAGFLRIRDSEIPLDNSAIHPESYYIVEKIASDLKRPVEEILGKDEGLDALDKNTYVDDRVGLPTIEDIIEELKKPGRDPRDDFQQVKFRSDVTEMEHLTEGMVLEGRVSNVTRFGVFVDIGVHQDGLVHISEISNKYIKDPTEVVKVGQIIKVKVIGVEGERSRISLSIKALTAPVKQKTSRSRRKPVDGERKQGGGAPGARSGERTEKPRGKKQPPQKKAVPPKEEKLRTLDDLLNRFGHPHKPRLDN